VAPGEPVPGVNGTGAIDCGDIKLCICADADIGTSKASMKAAANAAAAHRLIFTPHLRMRTFFDLNRGNFKPAGASVSRLTRRRFHHIVASGLLPTLLRPIMDRHKCSARCKLTFKIDTRGLGEYQ
jgi:hypothetical protein